MPDRIRLGGFAYVRHPALPFDVFALMGDLAETGQALAEGDLTAALARDKSRLRLYLEDLLRDPRLREAIFLASHSLHEALEKWTSAPDSEQGVKVQRSLLRYLARMCSRSTPFALFSGGGVAPLGDASRLVTGNFDEMKRHSRLDMDYVCALVEHLCQRPEVKPHLRYCVNSSLHRSPTGHHYVQAKSRGGLRSFELVALDSSPHLTAALETAAKGSDLETIAAAIAAVDLEVSVEEARSYIEELLENDVLIADLSAKVTGKEPVPTLVRDLENLNLCGDVTSVLREVLIDLDFMDHTRSANSPEAYRKVANKLAPLGVPVDMSRLFQVDIVQPTGNCVVGREIIQLIETGLEVLRFAGFANENSLSNFRGSFIQRYGDAEVPLPEALNEEFGIGLEPFSSTAGAPLLDGMNLGSDQKSSAISPFEEFLLRKVSEAVRQRKSQVELKLEDLKTFRDEPLPIPSLSCVFCHVASPPGERPSVHMASIVNGARILGRFCHADPELRERLGDLLRAEEHALDSDAVHAEIVHLPAGRVGNILARPCLREYEIPFLGTSGAPAEAQLPIDDLLVSVVENRVLLRSKRLGRRVIPHLSSAHNYFTQGLALYRFLCMLSDQEAGAAVNFKLGVVSRLPQIPRIICGRIVLSLAQWNIEASELNKRRDLPESDALVEMKALRLHHALPRFVRLVEVDQELCIDMENPLSLLALRRTLQSRSMVNLVEMFPDRDGLSLSSMNGRYHHEFIVPFVSSGVEAPVTQPKAIPEVAPRNYIPGAEWSYAKVYCGPAMTERVLQEAVAAFVHTQDISKWFFIRYADPDNHLRIRWLISDPVRRTRQREAFQDIMSERHRRGWVWKVQFDTYQRELSRYGGAEVIDAVESLFHHDSAFVLKTLACQKDRGAADLRWQSCLLSIRGWLDDFGISLEDRQTMFDRLRMDFAREHGRWRTLEQQLSRKYRTSTRKEVERILSSRDDETWGEEASILRDRSTACRPHMVSLAAADLQGKTTRPRASILGAVIHMSCNRMFRESARAQELVIYDHLYRYYWSLAARGRVSGNLAGAAP